MRIWTRKSALIQPRTSSGKSDCVVAHGPDGRPRAQAVRVRAPGRGASSPWARTPSLFPGLVLGWIDADFRVQIRIFQHFSSSTRKSSSREQICKIWQNFAEFCKIFEIFFEFSEKMQKKFFLFTNFLQNFYRILQNLVDFEKC